MTIVADQPDQLKVGEYVDILIKNARIFDVVESGNILVETDNGSVLTWKPNDHQVQAARVAPVEWPPRHGDLWRDRDDKLWVWRSYYTAYNSEYSSTEVEEFVSLDGKRPHFGGDAADVLRDFGPMALVHRVIEAGA